MNVRPARNSDEVWLLDKLEEVGVDDPGFRSRDYVVAYTDADDPCGAGRIRYRETDDGDDIAELDNIVEFAGHQGPPPTRDIVRGLIEKVSDDDIDRVYSADPPREIEDAFDGEWISLTVDNETVNAFVIPVADVGSAGTSENFSEELADEFGYDEETTTKYSID